MQSFSNRLIALRKERGLTQGELAEKLNLTRSNISGYETQGKEPRFDALCNMAKFFNVTTDYLLGKSSMRTNFIYDTKGFEKHFEQTSLQAKKIIISCFNSIYAMLFKDMQKNNINKLNLFSKLFAAVQKNRTSIGNSIESNAQNDPAFLTKIMLEQTNFKNEISAILDEMLQDDFGVVVKKENQSSSLYTKM